MRPIHIACVVPFLLASVGAPRTGGREQAVFRSTVRTVSIYATVIDRDGRLVPDLDRSAFQVLDDGRPVDLTVFSNDVQPITVAMMLDMSTSMADRVLRVRDSAARFIDAIARGDRARIGTFGAEVAISPILTDDKQVLRRVLHEELWPGGGTPLWRALLTAMTSLRAQSGRRVILVLTDGDDSDALRSHPGVSDVKRRAVREEFMVYAIGTERMGSGRAPSGPTLVTSGGVTSGSLAGTYSGGLSADIVDVVEETGGGHFEMKSDADLGDTFARVAEELRHQYVLGFSSTSSDGKVHKLEVRATRAECRVRARRSYVAQQEER